MAEAADKFNAVRDRMLLLIERHPAASLLFRIANRPERDEKDKRAPHTQLKPATGIVSNFPVVYDIQFPRTQWQAFGPERDWTLGGEPEPDEVTRWVEDFEIVVYHESLNTNVNRAEDRVLLAALNAGGRQLADPQTADSELPYVTFWGTADVRRQREMYEGGPRGASRFLIPVIMDLKPSEYLNA